MDVTQALHDAENALRDLINEVLKQAFGDNWIDNSGVTQDKIRKWRDTKRIEEKNQEAGVAEERLLYYADFSDLATILNKHWDGYFAKILGDWETFKIRLADLKRLRNSDAHRRELLPHQKSLIIGISGEIRNRIIRYRNTLENVDKYFPKIESVRDSLGDIWVAGTSFPLGSYTDKILRPGESIEFVVTAYDPVIPPLLAAARSRV
ncbi:MAG: Swt1 family HEPN domain-containing protein [Terriglobia bacterium]